MSLQLNRPSHNHRNEQIVAGVIKIFRAGSPIRDVVVIKVFSEDDLTEEPTCRSQQGGSEYDRAKVTNL
jgi:hypothetical protein